jgi:hypothetical protein
LAGARREVAITRPANGRDGVQLDEQQQRAYAYATEGDARLKVITGVPGAGKTRLIDAVAAAYAEAGYNVRAVSVANSAVDVVMRETSVPARSVTNEVDEWGKGRGRLTHRDLLIIDEASTLGSAQGAALLHQANERRAVVIAVGDDKQFQAVAHGSALEMMMRAVGDRSVDMQKTRRQNEGWQREATEAVRRGEIRAAIDAYRERGFVHESGSQDEARVALVDRWRAIESTGVECGIEAFTNRERIAINELAREQWRDMGRLAGADVKLETIDGNVSYAVGDRVIIRETIREAGLINGSVGIVRGIDDATLRIERRDGVVVPVDTREHPGVQHGYGSTEYREQGSTRYAELQLVTAHVNQRSLTVGMTRHTAEYGMFYSREAVGSYDDLVGLGMRTRSKELASDYREIERVQTREVEPMREVGPMRKAEPVREVEPTREVAFGELRRELEPIAQGREMGYSREERKAAFSVLNALELLERDAPHHQLRVPKDWHHSLRDPSALRTQISEAREYAVELARAQAAEKAQQIEHTKELERDRNRGRGMGRGR